eukprot:1024163-Alexandrium_andersonii.AAC.1
MPPDQGEQVRGALRAGAGPEGGAAAGRFEPIALCERGPPAGEAGRPAPAGRTERESEAPTRKGRAREAADPAESGVGRSVALELLGVRGTLRWAKNGAENHPM